MCGSAIGRTLSVVIRPQRYTPIQVNGRIAAPRPAPDGPGISTAVVHEDELIRAGLETLIAGLPQVRTVVAHASWSSLTHSLANGDPPAAAVIAHSLVHADPDRMAAIRSARTRVLLLLEAADNVELADAAGLEPDGFLVERGLTTQILSTALRQTLSGQIPMAPQVASEMLAELQNPNRISLLGLNQLTPREQETLTLLVEGRSNKQIASRLGISINGAKRHVANVLAKLNCPNRTLAAAEAVRLGVI